MPTSALPTERISKPGAGIRPSGERLRAAIALQQQGKLAQAGAIYIDILQSEPDHPDCLHLLGILAAHAGNHQAAIALIDRAIAVFPGDASFHNHRGNVLRALGLLETALDSYDAAIARKPDDAEAHYNRGVALHDLRRFDAAVASYDNAIAIGAAYAHAYYNRGNALQELGRFAAAIDSYDHAIAIDPAYADAYNNRGNALAGLHRFEAAIADFDKAIAIRPGSAGSHYNRGIALRAIRQLDAALASFNRAIALQSDNADAQWNKSLLLLLQGDMAQGWELYESRWQTAGFIASKRKFHQPRWRGAESLHGKTILLHNDQGLGDAIQFCRYATRVAGLGATVVLEVARPLAALLGTVDGVAAVVAAGEPLPAFDFQCPLASLPLAFRTDLNSIPAPNAYLESDPRKVDHWAARLGPRTRPRVGLVASGNPRHGNDANRSMPLADMLRHLPRDLEYVVLQKDLRDADRAALAAHPDVHFFGDLLDDFRDTAALCTLMNVVVSVDTSVAHLAAALGRPTWVLLPHVPDWRWLLDRTDSVWYSAVRLYRQPSAGAWAAVLGEVAQALRQLHPARPAIG